ncbi:polysaccharide pyruvyl transferase family protein [Anaeromicropila populeti]|uniref:Coenzyme F420-reducing hydrogenase, beta subunit n=1 Tax=Anaeromicropila populeti TaxID=37658 RepID=A0A1I6HR00_9FIRM|nr:polysaccharide pyruvyl transferase family protein [Anaeromicropila populeti]SFR56876.1 Coenzyme F420-reducing hydrogenase, beta subunit [Anaeromicropila populeti]
MKIGIVTFNSAHNYGAVLQAWALQEYLKSEGHSPSIINYRIFDIDKLYRLYKPKNPYKKPVLNDLVHRAQEFKARLRDKNKYKKYKKFEHFINHTLYTTNPVKNYGQLLKEEFDYDVMIAGSDQIWNGVFTKMNPGYFLAFGNDDVKRISYAASIGKDEISDVEAMPFQKYIRNFDYISVREEKAKEQVQRFTDKDIEVVVDPTLLLPREKYDALKKDPKLKKEYIYVHNVHLNKVDERLNAMAEELSKRTGLGIVQNRADYTFPNEYHKFIDGGPEEFIGWIANARYVIANSFHATVFSMIYHREFITIPHFQNPDRMRFFLDSLGIGSHLIDVPEHLPEDLSKLRINYSEVEEKRKRMRERSIAFLKRAIESRKTTAGYAKDKKYFDYNDPYRCYGCRACESICPTGAIQMEGDKEGFIYPVIQYDKCIYCNKCREVCIYQKPELFIPMTENLPKVYAAFHKDEEIRKKTASSGVYHAFYDYMKRTKGFVVNVKMDSEYNPVYAIEAGDACNDFCGVRFVNGNSKQIKPTVKKLLEEGKKVFYSGNPCEIAGLHSYLAKEYENLYTAEVVCTGIPSPEVYQQYKTFLEEKYHSQIVKMDFDNRFKGKTKGYFIAEFESGEVLLEESRKNNYVNNYTNYNLQRPTCYTCEFMNSQESVADITIGAFAKVEKLHPEMGEFYGTSFIRLNTIKGQVLFEGVKENLNIEESTLENAYQNTRKSAIPLTFSRSLLMNQLSTKTINALLQEYNSLKHKKKKR